ncbi:LysR family transcriptional regulator [Sphingobium sp. LB126]|uniref:LysR family transcriptional regulator n=1 Tax=Sphingobium sp. LB126 TaxID=1983755 RepID=UPI0018D55C4E|nr:LysR family transcriptional regulator [Sphingobium sp. LB126]
MNLLLVFDALLREKTLTRAGQSLGITQSGASHALKRLRVFFGDPLFVRSGSGVVPTVKGRALGTTVSRLVATLRDEVLPIVPFDPRNSRRTFTLCLSDMGELVFLPALVERLRQDAPLIEVRTMQAAGRQLDTVLGTGEADLAIGRLGQLPEELVQQELFMHDYLSIVHPSNAAGGAPILQEEFSALSHVVVDVGRAGVIVRHDAAIDEAGVKRNVSITTTNFLSVPWLVAQHSDYVATVPRSLGVKFSRYGIVALRDPPISLPAFALRQYWHRRFHLDPANRWLRELVKEGFNRSGAEIR